MTSLEKGLSSHAYKVSESSSEYQEYKEGLRQQTPLKMKENFFDRETIDLLDNLEKEEVKEAIHQKKEKILQTSYKDFLRFLDWDRMNMAVDKLFKDCLKNLELQAVLMKEIYDSPSTDSFENLKNLRRAFKDGKVSLATYEKILRYHSKEFSLKEERFLKNEWPNYKERFKEKIQTVLQRYNIPITEQLIAERLEEVKFSMIDSFESAQEIENASHDVENDVLRVSEQVLVSKAYAEHVIFHEFLHVISGRTITARVSSFQEQLQAGEQPVDITSQEINQSRSGLFLFNRQKGNIEEVVNPRFYWLNEAITESLALELLREGEKEGILYYPERELFTLLLQQGNPPLTQDIFYQAYFDNYNPQAKKIPSFSELVRQIDNSYQKGFLLKLEDFYKKNGIFKTIEVMQSDWRTIII